mgnify:CR=1 FL=1
MLLLLWLCGPAHHQPHPLRAMLLLLLVHYLQPTLGQPPVVVVLSQ